ncbi:MAG: DUF4062 domain-containing protein [Mesorhizobium sp.]|nr:MAG: DUF4062 domain-containing protein [Mesorhizobium sp.]
MDVKYQVFVSSTYEDLKAERRAVIEAILNLGHIPVGMELFNANDETQWDYIRGRIDECDYYLVIVAERYGSEKKGKSYTQMEFEYAIKKKVPCISFLLHEDARKAWPRDNVEFEKKDNVEGFRKLCGQKLVKFWKNADELGMQVAVNLPALVKSKPRTGWVRADNVPSTSVLNEMALLSDEKRSLQQKVNELSASEDLVIPSEDIWRIRRLYDEDIEETLGFVVEEGGPTRLLNVFLDLEIVLINDPDIHDLVDHFKEAIGFDLEEYQVETVMDRFVKYALLEADRVGDGRVKTYYLNPAGKNFMMYAEEWKSRQSAEKSQATASTT